MSKTKGFLAAVLSLGVMLGAGLLLTASSSPAEEGKPPEAISLQANLTLAENLAALKGRSVTVILASGESLSGKVKAVGPGLLHLESLAGKEFYDALVVIEDISALEARARGN